MDRSEMIAHRAAPAGGEASPASQTLSEGSAAWAGSANPRRAQRRQLTYLFMILDFLGVSVAIMVTCLVFPEELPKHPTLSQAIGPLYTVLLVVLGGRLGAYSVRMGYRTRSLVWRPVAAHLGATLILWILARALADEPLQGGFLALNAAVGCAISAMFRVLVRRGEVDDVFRHRVVILGEGPSATFLRNALLNMPEVKVVGLVRLSRGPVSPTIRNAVLGSVEDLARIAKEREADLVVVTHDVSGDRLADRMYMALSLCAEHGVEVVRMAEFYEQWLDMVPIAYVDDGWCVHGFTYQVEAYYDLVHRALDVVAAVLGLVVVGILYVPIAIAIKLTSRGPVIYSSSDPKFQRVGLRGSLFRIYKFRTMRQDVPKYIGAYVGEDDPRITLVGKILRKTKLDELPQLWNVLRGDMSIVGPRPICACEDDEMLQQVPLYHLRRLVRPGMTGLGQVSFGTAKLPCQHAWRLQYDLHYIKRRSLSLDMYVIFRTLLVCLNLRRRGFAGFVTQSDGT